MVDPLYAYNHERTGQVDHWCRLLRGSKFPAEYAGDYFFGDYVGNYIKRYDLATGTVTDFATNALNPVDLDVGPDGALYYLSVETRKVHRIAYGDGAATSATDRRRQPDRERRLRDRLRLARPWLWSVRSPAQATLARDTLAPAAGCRVAALDRQRSVARTGTPSCSSRTFRSSPAAEHTLDVRRARVSAVASSELPSSGTPRRTRSTSSSR